MERCAITGKVLVVDDSADIHRAFEDVLQNCYDSSRVNTILDSFLEETEEIEQPCFDVDLVFATQGEEAVDVLRRARKSGAPFDMVFLDMRMPPGMDGVETARCIRAEDEQLPLVFCSAYSEYSQAELLQEFGQRDTDLITKPFLPSAVHEIIERRLGSDRHLGKN